MSWFEILLKFSPLVAEGIITVLHATGADKHKTVAGQIAGGLAAVGEVAAAADAKLRNGATAPEAAATGP